MREEDTSNWFSRWEEELPSPEELMPLSQTLISPDLAIAFDIRNTSQQHHVLPPSSNPLPSPANPSQPGSADSVEMGSGSAGEEPARTLKRPRLVWTPQLHKRFVDAVAHLGIKNAVPKTIMQFMSVEGLTRENVASHLQKYRLYLKRMQGFSTVGGGVVSVDPATDNLFASSPVPPHFLPFVTVPALQQQQQQMVAAVAGGHLQFHRQVGHFDVPFLSISRQPQGQYIMGAPMHNPVTGHAEDMESANVLGGRKVLTLFPTGDD